MQYPLDGNSVQPQNPSFEKAKFYVCKEAKSHNFTVGKVYLCCSFINELHLVTNGGDLLKIGYLDSKFIPA